MSVNDKRIRMFFSYYKPYRGLLAADIIAALVVSVISLVLPLCVRYITKDVLRSSGGNIAYSLMAIALVMLGLIILQSACALFYDHKGHDMGARMERDMRNDLFAHYQTLGFSFFDREKTGAVISRVTNDLLSIAELCHHGPEDIIIYAMTFIGALIILITINLELALGICVFLPVMFIFSALYGKTLKKAYTQSREQIATVNARIEDSIAGIRTVKSFGNEELEITRFRDANERFYQSRAAIYKHEARYYTGISIFFTRLIMVVTVVFGGLKLSGASLDIADLLSFLLYADYLTAPLPQLARITAQYQEGISGFNRFMDVMETSGEVYEHQNALNISKVKGDIEFLQVGFKYNAGNDYVFKDLSFKVRSGEYIALTGPSGIGKTTLCSLIPRFYEVSSGAILLDGRDLRDIGVQSLRKHIGVVQQDAYIFAGTIRENIVYGKPGAPEDAIIAAARQSHAHSFITALPQGYDTVIGPKGVTLSGGQRQRLCIARVFLKDPAILIFDEATSALDYESEQAVQESLKALARNRTTFVIAHRLSTLKDADRILVFNGQEIREQITFK
ncbi:MAG: ABC transporter ATP-binding protein/permease [Treponema sp.]|jgi:ATP-binding cassette subfamily B protein|nr:ABC transporter ATP-binding protein/permease [Treponema sp.]